MKVLLTNDDGPPHPVTSPFVWAFYEQITALGWDVKVVLPSSQKSWIGKAFHITEITKGRYFYPTKPDGLSGETSPISRPLKDGEVAEWILLDGTPATCANVALHNLYPGQIDLVISGPNLGRNTSSAFALSSGTIGAALSASLSKTRSIALSYGVVVHPTPSEFLEPSHMLACRIIRHLWDNWGHDDGLRAGEVDLYNVNIPLVEGLLTDEGLKIMWTCMWRNSYGRLFKDVSGATTDKVLQMNATGSGALLPTHPPDGDATSSNGTLAFKFSPAMEGLIHPEESSLPVGSDGWAMFKGYASVTPLRSGFAEPAGEATRNIEDRVWKMKL
ncbi:survival protein sure-like phosphatase/nucleotidase [Mycena belliarum]|uniref:Survival protein sure-like phosphatase/nucleotidase n=1 Tax=Mycena belliarum TaxID=1033014 RepID=A0AAD6UMB0_9AGAR|nr:survival protein sure-like phosphatase/nucleotidase [Mycena belliae]